MDAKKPSAFVKYKNKYVPMREIPLDGGNTLIIQPTFFKTHLDVTYNDRKIGKIRIGFMLQKKFQKDLDGKSLVIESKIPRKTNYSGRAVDITVLLDDEIILEFREVWMKN